MATVLQLSPEITPLPPPLHRFTVKQYQRMIETGVLTEDDRVELLEGWIVDKMLHNPPHDGTINRINRRLMRLLPDEWLLRVQSAITLARSEPEPDLAIVRGPEEIYFTRHPVPRDIALLIEVADATLLPDREYKGRIYAQGRIPEYWIVNLVESKMEIYTQPKAGKSPSYRRRQDHANKEAIVLILEGRPIAEIPVADLLP
jgi:Uma2 family endonuclease